MNFNSLEDINSFIIEQKNKKTLLEGRKNILLKELEYNSKWVAASIKAREAVNVLSQKTLTMISVEIGKLVTETIYSVFENPYEFDIEFITRRNQTECDLWVVRNNRRRHPLDSNGGGLADIISVALRCTFLVLSKVRPVLILDEPFKFLSEDLQNYCFMMLKTISDNLGIQIIVISHLKEMKEIADTIYNVTQLNGISFVKKVK